MLNLTAVSAMLKINPAHSKKTRRLPPNLLFLLFDSLFIEAFLSASLDPLGLPCIKELSMFLSASSSFAASSHSFALFGTHGKNKTGSKVAMLAIKTRSKSLSKFVFVIPKESESAPQVH